MSLNEQTLALPPSLMREVDKALEAWASNANTRRLWRADATLWTSGDEGDWLGPYQFQVAVLRQFLRIP